MNTIELTNEQRAFLIWVRDTYGYRLIDDIFDFISDRIKTNSYSPSQKELLNDIRNEFIHIYIKK